MPITQETRYYRLKNWQDSNPLRTWAKQEKIPFAAAAVQIGVSYWAMRMWMAGQTRPNSDNMRAVAQTMNLPLYEIQRLWDEWLLHKPLMEKV